MDGLRSEGVYVAVPGTDRMGWRYTSRDAVPLLDRWRAEQIGAAGFWYVTELFSNSEYTPTVSERVAVAVEKVNDATGADRGLLGVVARLLGIPHGLALVVVLVAAYAIARKFGLVPSLSDLK